MNRRQDGAVHSDAKTLSGTVVFLSAGRRARPKPILDLLAEESSKS
jgi:hypothetical protein